MVIWVVEESDKFEYTGKSLESDPIVVLIIDTPFLQFVEKTEAG